MTWVLTAVMQKIHDLESSEEVHELALAINRALYVFVMKLR